LVLPQHCKRFYAVETSGKSKQRADDFAFIISEYYLSITTESGQIVGQKEKLICKWREKGRVTGKRSEIRRDERGLELT
jgi:hypothetical protein